MAIIARARIKPCWFVKTLSYNSGGAPYSSRRATLTSAASSGGPSTSAAFGVVDAHDADTTSATAGSKTRPCRRIQAQTLRAANTKDTSHQRQGNGPCFSQTLPQTLQEAHGTYALRRRRHVHLITAIFEAFDEVEEVAGSLHEEPNPRLPFDGHELP